MRTDAIRLTQVQQARLRRDAIRLRENGASNAEVAQILSVHAKTVSGWWAAYRRIGEALFEPGKRGRRRGNKRRLTGAQEREVQRLIIELLPDRLELSSALWTKTAIGELVERRYAIVLPVRTLGEYLRRWGYTPPRPQTRARERDDRAIGIWLEETYPAIVRGARREKAQLFWGDQTALTAGPPWDPAAASMKHATVIGQTATPTARSMIRAVTNRGAVRFLVYKGALSAAVLVLFCGRLLVSAEGRVVHLIVDQLPVHHAAAFRLWMDSHRQQFTISYLPAVPVD